MPFDWTSLLLYIKERRVVPIVGAEAISIGVDGQTLPLERYLARHLIDKLGMEAGSFGDMPSLSDVANAFIRQYRGDRKKLWVEILSLFQDAPLQLSDGLRQLAAITDFELYVTTGFDPMLTRALAEVRGDLLNDRNVRAYSLRSQVMDLDSDWPNARPLTVYHLFGRMAASGDYVVTDEDRLEFTHALQSAARQPAVLFDQLRDSHLLLIGCSFPDWFTRFFLRGLRRERLTIERDQSEAIADDRTINDRSLALFLGDCRAQIYREGGTAQFVAELNQRWRSQHVLPAKPIPPPTLETAPNIFLSYASEDRDRVLRIKQAFEQAGVSVWFDQRALEPGDEYKDVIKEAIQKCTFFLPCISANSLTSQIRRFFRFEWNTALDDADFRIKDPPFIQPLILDATPADSVRIPPKFRELHMQACPDGGVPPEFIALTKSRLNTIGESGGRS